MKLVLVVEIRDYAGVHFLVLDVTVRLPLNHKIQKRFCRQLLRIKLVEQLVSLPFHVLICLWVWRPGKLREHLNNLLVDFLCPLFNFLAEFLRLTKQLLEDDRNHLQLQLSLFEDTVQHRYR